MTDGKPFNKVTLDPTKGRYMFILLEGATEEDKRDLMMNLDRAQKTGQHVILSAKVKVLDADAKALGEEKEVSEAPIKITYVPSEVNHSPATPV